MNGRATVVVVALLCGCARGSAGLLDASIRAIDESDGSIGQEDSDAGLDEDPSQGGDGDGDGDCTAGEPDCIPSKHDAATPGHDAGATPADAGEPSGHDASSTPQVIRASFRVKQVNAALQQPVVTDLQLEAGDELRISGGGYIWPGLIAQGCNGPDGTTGKHDSAAWPLKGGPDFALVGFVDGAWVLVGTERTFQVATAGRLQLGTNDDDNGSGDDCTSVPEDERGFSVSVQITRR